MKANLLELFLIIQEGIRSKSAKDMFVVEHELDSIIWKIKSGRMKDIDLSDTLRFQELLKPKQPKDGN